MKIFLLTPAILVVAVVNSCSKSGVEFKEGSHIMGLKQCEEGKVSGDKFILCFDSVISDSRCPANAMCIWQGTATAKFSIRKNGESSSFVLSTLNMAGTYNKDTVLFGYKIEFINLTPYPGTVPSPIPSNQIKAELKIIKQ